MKRSSLAELMGAEASEGKLSLSQLGNILGDAKPELPKNEVGRHRLIRALQQRFGKNFRSLPGVSDLVKEFDADLAHEAKLRKLREIKVNRG